MSVGSTMQSFDLAWQAYPVGLREAAGEPIVSISGRSQELRTHDALVAYAEAHGIERDAP